MKIPAKVYPRLRACLPSANIKQSNSPYVLSVAEHVHSTLHNIYQAIPRDKFGGHYPDLHNFENRHAPAQENNARIVGNLQEEVRRWGLHNLSSIMQQQYQLSSSCLALTMS